MKILQLFLLLVSFNSCLSQVTDSFLQNYPFREVELSSNINRDTTITFSYPKYRLQLKNYDVNYNVIDYRVYNLKNNLIEEGKADWGRRCRDCQGRTGKWVFYYDNGNKSAEGYFYRHKPIGLWKQYYANGSLMKVFSYVPVGKDSSDKGICLGGSYLEYYENGQTKIEGMYQAMLDTNAIETLDYESPVSGERSLLKFHVYGARSIKYGEWNYYLENGSLLKKESY